jgi:flagellar basal body rod protein FlgF
MAVFETPAPVLVRIELAQGEVRLIASDRTDSVVDVRPADASVAADVKAAERTKVDFSQGKLMIKGPRPRPMSMGRGGVVEVRVEVPTGSRIEAGAAMVGFLGEGVFGDCQITTAMGNIDLERTGALQVTAAHGTITVDTVGGKADVTAGSGAVWLRSVDGPAVVKNSNGNTTIGEIAGDLEVRAANGDITVERARAGVKVRTAHGTIKLGEVIRGSVNIETAAGELEVGIRRGSVAWLDLNSTVGRVRNELDSSEAPGKSEDTVEVRARTVAGNILVRRSA